MPEIQDEKNQSTNALDETTPKWDYTSREQTLFIGAIVVGLNLLIVLAAILDRTVPAVHSFISGKPI